MKLKKRKQNPWLNSKANPGPKRHKTCLIITNIQSCAYIYSLVRHKVSWFAQPSMICEVGTIFFPWFSPYPITETYSQYVRKQRDDIAQRVNFNSYQPATFTSANLKCVAPGQLSSEAHFFIGLPLCITTRDVERTRKTFLNNDVLPWSSR